MMGTGTEPDLSGDTDSGAPPSKMPRHDGNEGATTGPPQAVAAGAVSAGGAPEIPMETLATEEGQQDQEGDDDASGPRFTHAHP